LCEVTAEIIVGNYSYDLFALFQRVLHVEHEIFAYPEIPILIPNTVAFFFKSPGNPFSPRTIGLSKANKAVSHRIALRSRMRIEECAAVTRWTRVVVQITSADD
jgi:hypothetical protein